MDDSERDPMTGAMETDGYAPSPPFCFRRFLVVQLSFIYPCATNPLASLLSNIGFLEAGIMADYDRRGSGDHYICKKRYRGELPQLQVPERLHAIC